ncbi:hypothetical protein AGMMS50293_31080 [Spirochaetia bacterium]|nr:hypothetical protein AGMMS50293_31080 [Spirochaetia bacterium]
MDLPKTKKEFLNKYYLKNELVEMCKENDLPIIGSKENLINYICDFIENKPIIKIKNEPKKKNNGFIPSLEKRIDINYSNDEIHRTFFIKEIGKHFKYNIQFMNWMNENKGKKTYQEAIETWNKIYLDKKSGKKYKIGTQFEYNQYTRDFFENNPELSREECIKCWKYKKQQMGKHIYEKEDLKILSK